MADTQETKLNTRDLFSILQVVAIISGAVWVVGNVSNKTQLVNQSVDNLKESVNSNVRSLQVSLDELKNVIRDLNVSSVDSRNKILVLEAQMKSVESAVKSNSERFGPLEANQNSLRLEMELLKKEKK